MFIDTFVSLEYEKEKEMKKRLLAIIATVAMVVVLVPSMVFADVDPTDVAKIGNTGYATLQEAIDAVGEGETIILLKDVNVTTPAYGQNALNYAKAINCTIDLNGKTLSADTGNSVFRFNIGGSGAISDITVTMKNGKVVAGSNTWCAVMAGGISSDARAIFNLENLTIESSKGYDFAVKSWSNALIKAENVTVNPTNAAGGFYALGGEIILDNCVVNQKGLYSAPYTSMAFGVSDNGKMTINSGVYSATPTSADEGNGQGSTHGSWVGGVMNSGGTLIINGGTFSNGNYGEDALATNARGALFVDTSGKLEINGGTFNALGAVVEMQNNLGDASNNPKAEITEGTFNAGGSTMFSGDPSGLINVSGGTFNVDVSEYLADGYEMDGNEVVCSHENTVSVDKMPTCTEDGFKGAKKCNACGEIIEEGEIVKATGHTYKDGACTVCGEKAPAENKPADAVDTGDDSNMVLPLAIAGLVLAAMAAVVATRRKYN